MNTKPNPLALAAALALALPGIASANLITFQVDLSVQTTLGNFNPAADRVLVAGEFSAPDWIPVATTAFVLTNDPGSPNIYRNTFTNDLPTGEWHDYKFIIDVGSTAASPSWETIPDRGFQVSAADQVLPVVYFNNITPTTTLVATQVTFSVNMGVQETLGNFVPATDVVWVAGDAFNNSWAEGAQVLTRSLDFPDLWSGTFLITNTVGTTVNYKFIKFTVATGVAWEANGVGPGGANDRQFIFTNQATALPVVYFNNITPTSTLVTTQVTFKVNLAVPIARGTFDPNTGTVTVAGDVFNNNWDAAAQPLTQTPTNASVWSGTFNLTNAVGGAVNYKFTLENGGSWEANGVGPGGANDRQFIFTNQATVLPDVYFNNLGNLGPLTNAAPSGGLINVSWGAGPLIRLQTNSSFPGVWVDVPGSQGLNAMDVDASAAPLYFRLIGPW
jgi:hypothetical protein